MKLLAAQFQQWPVSNQGQQYAHACAFSLLVVWALLQLQGLSTYCQWCRWHLRPHKQAAAAVTVKNKISVKQHAVLR
jgi:hypothetical protein